MKLEIKKNIQKEISEIEADLKELNKQATNLATQLKVELKDKYFEFPFQSKSPLPRLPIDLTGYNVKIFQANWDKLALLVIKDEQFSTIIVSPDRYAFSANRFKIELTYTFSGEREVNGIPFNYFLRYCSDLFSESLKKEADSHVEALTKALKKRRKLKDLLENADCLQKLEQKYERGS